MTVDGVDLTDSLDGHVRIGSALLAAYTRAVDTHDYDHLVSLFTPEARVNLGRSMLRGRDAIGAAYRRSFASSRTTKHLVTNLLAEGSEPGAPRVTAYLFVTGLKADVLSLSWGTYECTARSVESRWLIDELSITLDVPFLELPTTSSVH